MHLSISLSTCRFWYYEYCIRTFLVKIKIVSNIKVKDYA